MNRPRIAVVGSLNMDLVVSTERMPRVGETISGKTIHYIPGGKGANQAVGCARLGAEVHMIGAVGDDMFGSVLMTNMKDNGVCTDGIGIIEHTPTGIASILHTSEDNCIVIIPGANGAMTPARVEQSARFIAQADLVLIQLEIPLESVYAALRIARSAGVRTVLNPAPARDLSADLLQLADCITPNETEFASLGGFMETDGQDAWQDGLSNWEKRHDHKVILTRGKHGASYRNNGQPVTIPAPVVAAVDSTGAGDCLNAAFGFGLASGWSIEQSLKFAVKAASLSVTKFGAQAGMPTIEEIERMDI
ncbi:MULTISPECIES: ribokinase [Cohnella]|uniref:Ribokinase n=1 Tax=Cohnella phaseoli TaxID=456490 RepID=A0A3D9KQX3_9BACL|nr:ribokinase [Cohnella phaseoli]RED89071.1 ribokinase [Cohnella phaseoli]